VLPQCILPWIAFFCCASSALEGAWLHHEDPPPVTAAAPSFSCRTPAKFAGSRTGRPRRSKLRVQRAACLRRAFAPSSRPASRSDARSFRSRAFCWLDRRRWVKQWLHSTERGEANSPNDTWFADRLVGSLECRLFFFGFIFSTLFGGSYFPSLI